MNRKLWTNVKKKHKNNKNEKDKKKIIRKANKWKYKQKTDKRYRVKEQIRLNKLNNEQKEQKQTNKLMQNKQSRSPTGKNTKK